MYKCSECGKAFLRKIQVTLHKLIHSSEKPYRCSVCGKRFKQQNHLAFHKPIHSNERPLRCTNCNKRFKRKCNLARHKLIHSRKKLYHCLKCRKQFKLKAEFAKHLQVHSCKKMHECSWCGDRFKYKNILDKHFLVHTNKKPYECIKCHKRFGQKNKLVSHSVVHFEEKPFICSECGNSYKRNSDPAYHFPIQSDANSYLCSNCNKQFTQKRYLKKHNMHLLKKKYRCSQCSIQFTKKNDLGKHSLLHSNVRIYKCSMCNEQFGSVASLTQHTLMNLDKQQDMFVLNNQNYHCTICNRRFKSKSQLSQHILIHLNCIKKGNREKSENFENLKVKCNKKFLKLKHCEVQLEKVDWESYRKNKYYREMCNRQFGQKNDFLCQTQIFQSEPSQDNETEIKTINYSIFEESNFSVDSCVLNTADVSLINDELNLFNDTMVDTILSNLTKAEYESCIEQIWKSFEINTENEQKVTFEENSYPAMKNESIDENNKEYVMLQNVADIFPTMCNSGAFDDAVVDDSLQDLTMEELKLCIAQILRDHL